MTSLPTRRLLVPCATALLCVLEPCFAEAADTAAKQRVAGTRVAKPQRGSRRPFGTRTRRHSRKRAPAAPSAAVVTPEEEDVQPQASDPLERLNRGTFALNHQVYRFLLKPLSRVTTFLVPEPVLDAVGNVFENLKSPVRMTASLLQGKGRRAAQETAKLAVNSTVGIGGLWRASDRIEGLRNVPEEDFGQTLGVWGIKSGPYLVLPVLGPRSARDLVGMAADVCATPQTWVSAGNLNAWSTMADNVQRNPDRMQTYDDATKDALDPYIAVREAYSSYRANVVTK
jgi:phospholipid-binding lipoprotein MlaA